MVLSERSKLTAAMKSHQPHARVVAWVLLDY
jgi:hypothetical protein